MARSPLATVPLQRNVSSHPLLVKSGFIFCLVCFWLVQSHLNLTGFRNICKWCLFPGFENHGSLGWSCSLGPWLCNSIGITESAEFHTCEVFAELGHSFFQFLEDGLWAVPGRISPRYRTCSSYLFSRCYLVWAFFSTHSTHVA